MPADALATLGARASAGMVLSPQSWNITFPASVSSCCLTSIGIPIKINGNPYTQEDCFHIEMGLTSVIVRFGLCWSVLAGAWAAAGLQMTRGCGPLWCWATTWSRGPWRRPPVYWTPCVQDESGCWRDERGSCKRMGTVNNESTPLSKVPIVWSIKKFKGFSKTRIFINFIVYPYTLSHCGLVTPYGDINLGQHPMS